MDNMRGLKNLLRHIVTLPIGLFRGLRSGSFFGAVLLEDGRVLFNLPIRPEGVRDEGNVTEK